VALIGIKNTSSEAMRRRQTAQRNRLGTVLGKSVVGVPPHPVCAALADWEQREYGGSTDVTSPGTRSPRSGVELLPPAHVDPF